MLKETIQKETFYCIYNISVTIRGTSFKSLKYKPSNGGNASFHVKLNKAFSFRLEGLSTETVLAFENMILRVNITENFPIKLWRNCRSFGT